MKSSNYFKSHGRIILALGILMLLIYLFEYLFIAYFYSAGIRGKLSYFCLFIILAISGIGLTKGWRFGITLLHFFVVGTIINTIVSVILLYKFLAIFDLLLPTVVAVLEGYIIYFSPHSSHYKLTVKNHIFVFLSLITIIIIVGPKFLML